MREGRSQGFWGTWVESRERPEKEGRAHSWRVLWTPYPETPGNHWKMLNEREWVFGSAFSGDLSGTWEGRGLERAKAGSRACIVPAWSGRCPGVEVTWWKGKCIPETQNSMCKGLRCEKRNQVQKTGRPGYSLPAREWQGCDWKSEHCWHRVKDPEPVGVLDVVLFLDCTGRKWGQCASLSLNQTIT